MKKLLFCFAVLSLFSALSVQTTISGTPTVITTTTTTITRSNGTVNTVQTSASKLLPVQTTEITVIKSNGTVYTAVNIGQPIGTATLAPLVQQRIQLADVIIQGGTITVGANNKIFIDGEQTDYTAPANYTITNVTVWASDGQPTAILYDASDVAGATNQITYYMNGYDTGVTANTKITRTLTTAGGSTVTGSTISQQQVNGTVYYFVDGKQTEYTPNAQDKIIDTYTIVDPVVQNVKYVKDNQKAIVYRQNGTKVLQSTNLTSRAISSLTKNNTTIVGQLTAEQLYIVTKGEQKIIGRSVYVNNNLIYVDGVNTTFSSNDNSVNVTSKICYIVKDLQNNESFTQIEYSSQDNPTTVVYYVDNNTVTNIEKLETDNVITYDSSTETSNKIQNPVWTITTSNGKTYTASNVDTVYGRKIVKQDGTNLYYQTSKSSQNVDLIYRNGMLLGRKSDASFYTVKRSTTHDSISLYNIRESDSNVVINKVLDSVTQYYLPRFDGYYFVANNRVYQNNLTSISVVNYPNFSYSTYSAVKTDGAFVLLKDSNKLFLTAYQDYNQGDSQPVRYNVTKLGDRWANTSTYNRLVTYDLRYQDSILLAMNDASVDRGQKNSRAHCVNCFNNAAPGAYKSLAGYPGHSDRAMGVTTDGRMKMGQGHLRYYMGDYTNWEQVYLVGPAKNSNNAVFIARNSKNQVFWIKSYKDKQKYKLQQLNFSATKLASDRNGNAYAIDNKIVYKLTFTDTYTEKSTPTVAIKTNTTTLQSKATDIVVSTNNVGILTADKRLYVSDKNLTAILKTDLFNVEQIGCSAGAVVAVADNISVTEDVPVVKINNKQYDQSSVTVSTQSCYVLDGKSTNYVVQNNDTDESNPYCKLSLANDKTASVQASAITAYQYTNTISSPDSGVLGYISTSNDGKYIINGNLTDQPVYLTDKININSKKTYYIGDVNTNIEPKLNDNIAIKGDYWTINGYNTAVTYYGGKEMVIQISDVTPGEVTQNEDSSSSTVVVPLVIKGHISRFDDTKPIRQIRLQFRRLNDSNWTNIKILTNDKKSLETKTKNLQSFMGRYVNVPVSKSESFLLRCNITDGTTSTVTASSLNPQPNNVFYWNFIRSQHERPNK